MHFIHTYTYKNIAFGNLEISMYYFNNNNHNNNHNNKKRVVLYTVDDKIKFQILLRRMAVARLKSRGGETIRLDQRNIKNRFSNTMFRFFCLQAPEVELFGLKKLKPSYWKLSRGEVLVRPPHSFDVFLMLGSSQA